MKRLLSYLNPHKWVMTLATILVLFIIVVELYRPIVIGDAIDLYITGYYQPYAVTTEDGEGAVQYGDVWISREAAKEDADAYYQMILFEDHYYMVEDLTAEECEILKEADQKVLAEYVEEGATLLEKEDLKELRHFDFMGILRAAGMYLVLLILGLILNTVDTWMLQKMGQKIIYEMREEVFSHIHSLSLNFFNLTPVGKLVTRVSNDTEAIHELFANILVNLFKNVVKIIGYAVVMISIDAKMAGISFLLLPIVGVLTFTFRKYSRRAYQITRNKITDLNTFLSEHISGMKLIQIFAREEEKYDAFADKSMDLSAKASYFSSSRAKI